MESGILLNITLKGKTLQPAVVIKTLVAIRAGNFVVIKKENQEDAKTQIIGKLRLPDKDFLLFSVLVRLYLHT